MANAGAVLGSFSAPSFVTRAVPPSLFALALDALGARAAASD